MAIDRFQGEYRFLSNFWPAKVTYLGHEFPSVEHAYVAAKVTPADLTPELVAAIISKASGGDVKRYGRRLPLREDWTPEIRIAIMEDLVTQKFANPELRRLLLGTRRHGDLYEGNDWGDKFWGLVLRTGDGQNHLGQILMRVRDKAYNESLASGKEMLIPAEPASPFAEMLKKAPVKRRSTVQRLADDVAAQVMRSPTIRRAEDDVFILPPAPPVGGILTGSTDRLYGSLGGGVAQWMTTGVGQAAVQEHIPAETVIRDEVPREEFRAYSYRPAAPVPVDDTPAPAAPSWDTSAGEASSGSSGSLSDGDNT